MKKPPQFHLSRLATGLVAVAASVSLGSCVIPIGGAEIGDLRVTWSFDGLQRCASVGVDNVTIQLIEKDKEGAGAKAFGQTAECIAGSMVIPDIIAGTYIMTAVGVGEVAVFNNGAGATIEVVPNEEIAVDAPLSLANGEVVSRIEFQYTFDGEPVCSNAGVATINAQVVDENGIAIAGSNTACVDGLAAVDGIRVGDHTLEVEALDGNNAVIFVGQRSLTGLQAGETLRLDPIDLAPSLVDATVRYTFGNERFCARAGVATVDAQLIDDAGRVVSGQNVACVQGRVDFVDVPAGTYTLHMDGVDGNNTVQYTLDQDDVVLDTAFVDLGVVDLRAGSSLLRVRFDLPAGETCATLGIANVAINVVRGNNGDEDDGARAGGNADCIAGELQLVAPPPGNSVITAEAVVGDDVVLAVTQNLILQGGSQIVNLGLVPIRSIVEVAWDLEGRELNAQSPGATPIISDDVSCSEADVDNVLVRIRRGNQLLETTEVACDTGRVEIPGIVIAGGPVQVELVGSREQEGDETFLAASAPLTLSAARTQLTRTLVPSLAFARVIWTGDCGTANANTVDIQVTAGGLTQGINVACAQGNTLFALPRPAVGNNVQIALRGVDGQGVPDLVVDPNDRAELLQAVAGINTFTFAGPR